MKTYKNIDEFFVEAFPIEHEKIIKKENTNIEKSVERIDALFEQELDTILTGEEKQAKS